MSKFTFLLVLTTAFLVDNVHSKDRIIHGRLLKERIVGGENATHGDLPYMVSLRWFGSHFCGGTILDRHVIMTAAHCLYGYEEDPYEIVAGEWSLSQDDGTEQWRNSTRTLVHEGYNEDTFENDIALLWVDRPFTFTPYVQPVQLPPPMIFIPGPAQVSGWGVMEEDGGDLSDILKMAGLTSIPDAQCRGEVPNGDVDVKDSMICAYHPPGGIDSCQGDSGGPLMGTIEGRWPYQAGIVSWGYGCARPGMPGIYTEVSHFISWIHDGVASLAKM